MKKSLFLVGIFFLCSNSYANVIDSVKAANGPGLLCFGNQTYFAAYTDSSITTWQWDLDNDGQFDDAFSQNPIYTFSQPGNFTIQIKATTVYGTTDTVTSSVTIYPLPQVNFQADNLCAGKEAVYTSTSTITSGSITEYKWDFNNDGIDDNTSGPVVSYTCGPAQTYSTKLTCISDQGCTSFTIKTTTVYEQPVANFSVATACANEPVQFINTSTINNEIISINLWNYGDGTPNVDNGDSVFTHTFTTDASYSVTLVTITPNNCKDTLTKTVVVNPLPSAAVSSSDITNVSCKGGSNGSINLTVSTGTSPYTYNWSNNSVAEDPAGLTSGSYSVTVTDANGCKKTTSAVITEPFALSVTSDGTPTGITISGGVSPYKYYWSNDSSVMNPKFLEGTYTVTVTDSMSCTAVYTVTFAVTLNVVNDLLTPNEDGMNDYFMIENVDAYSNCDVTIYNIWGDKVFSKTGYKNDWNGTYNGSNGKELPAGSYYYIIQCDEKEKKVGNVNILR